MKHIIYPFMLLISSGVCAQSEIDWERRAELKPVALLSFADGFQLEFELDPATREITVAEQGGYGPMFDGDEDSETALQLYLKSTPADVPVPRALIRDHLQVADQTPLNYGRYPNTEELARQLEQRMVLDQVIRLNDIVVPDGAYASASRSSWCGGSYNSEYDPGTNTQWHARISQSPAQDWGHIFKTNSKRRAAKSEVNTCWLPAGASMTVKVGYASSLGGYVMQKDINVKGNAWGRVRVWNRAKRTRLALLDRHCSVTAAYDCDGSIRINYLWKGHLKSGWGKP